MDQIIKLESNSELFCIACARCDKQTFGEHEINVEIVSVFKELLKDYIQNLNGTPIVLCVGCMEILSTINDFKNKCIQTFLSLSSGVLNSMVDTLTHNYYPEIKLEETFTADVRVDGYENSLVKAIERDINMMKNETPMEKNGKSTKKVAKKKIKIIKPTPQRKKTKAKSAPVYKRQKAFCIICCSNKNDVYGHYLDTHSRQLDDGTLTCILCDESWIDVYQLESHMESQHKEFSHARKCGRCEAEIKNRKDFVEHVHMTHFKERKKIIPCDFCDSVYYENHIYKYHTWTHVGAVKCKYCDQSFFDETVFTEHQSIHKNVKRLQKLIMICDFCGYNTSNRQILIEHMLSHHVEGNEVKCKFCEKLFKTKKKLRTHIKTKHDPKIKPCPHCGKKFRSNTYLRHHIRVVHVEQPDAKLKKKEKPSIKRFECDLCDMKFYQNHSLKRHKYSHSKTRPYNCHLCATGYYMNTYLRGHYFRVHGIQYTPKEIRQMCGFGNPSGQGDSD